MMDFIANIKNKKNITMGNMKTFMTTSVLCVFFNGILIYGMKEENDTQKQEIKLNNINNIKNDNIENSINNEKPQIENINDMPSLNGKQNGKNFFETDENFKKLNTEDIILPDKEKDSNIFYNYKGNLSLCCCCNLWNNKKENQIKYDEEQRMLEDEQQKEDYKEILLEKSSEEGHSSRIRLIKNSENNNVNENNNMSVSVNNTEISKK